MALPSSQVVVARIGDAMVGLAVGRLRAILRVTVHAIDPAPAVLNRGEGEAQVQSICRLPGTEGLVAILSSECRSATKRWPTSWLTGAAGVQQWPRRRRRRTTPSVS